MSTLPASTLFTSSTIEEGQFKAAITQLRGYLSGLLGDAGEVGVAQITLGILLGAGVRQLTSATTLTGSDRGKVILCSGSFTLTMPPGASSGVGWAVAVKNNGSGTVTIAGNGGDTVDVPSVAAGASSFYVWSSSQWISIGGGAVSGGAAVLGIAGGGSGQTTAAAALAAFGGKKIAAGYGGLGTPYLVQSDNGYSVGSLYSLAINNISGSWRCMGRSGIVSGTSSDRIYIFERE